MQFNGRELLPYYLFFSIIWKSKACFVTNIVQNIIFSVQQKKEIHTCLGQFQGNLRVN